MRMVLLRALADPVVEHVEASDLALGLDAVGLSAGLSSLEGRTTLRAS